MLNRRSFLSLAAAGLSSVALVGCAAPPQPMTQPTPHPSPSTPAPPPPAPSSLALTPPTRPTATWAMTASTPALTWSSPKRVATRNDWEVQLEPVDWDAKDTMLDSGAINCIWNGFTMEGREDDYTFSEPYMINGQVVVVRADSGITSFDDLAGKAVITQVDSAAYNVLAGEDATQAELAATFASLETIGDYNTAFMQLESGAVDAVACDPLHRRLPARRQARRLCPARRVPLRGALPPSASRRATTPPPTWSTRLCVPWTRTASSRALRQVRGGRHLLRQLVPRVAHQKNSSPGCPSGEPPRHPAHEGNTVDFLTMTGMLSEGFLVSLQIFAFTLLGSLPLGMLVAFARMSRFKPLALSRPPVHLYHARPPRSCCRCLPSTSFRTTSLASASPRQQVVRHDRGLHHQLRRLLRGDLPLRHPVHPARPARGRRGPGLLAHADVCAHRAAQVVKRIMPSMTNEVITLVQDTSLAFSIGVIEMFTVAKQ